MALMPDPPMSIESVTGEELATEVWGTALGAGTAAVSALGLIRKALYRAKLTIVRFRSCGCDHGGTIARQPRALASMALMPTRQCR